MKNSVLVLSLVILITVGCSGSNEEKPAIFNEDGVALAGYDPVAYFAQGEAKKGTDIESATHDGLTYYFSSTKNKNAFIANPDSYLPEYGGWCAYAVAETSTKMEPDPTSWQIQDGKLLLFYDDWMTNITGNLKEEWNQDSINYKTKADKNWTSIEQ